MQTRLLDCRFALQKRRQLKERPESQDVVSDSSAHNYRKRKTPSDLTRAMAQLGGPRMMEVKKLAIKEILNAYGFRPVR